MTVAEPKRIFYLDALRALAILAVIIFHVYIATNSHVIFDYSAYPLFKRIFALIQGNCFRIGADLFLMLSGALLLGKVWDVKSFLSKRIPRIVIPFVFWASVSAVVAIFLSYFYGFKFINSFNSYALLRFVYGVFLGNSLGFTHYWFFWTIFGIYLMMPVFNRWLLYAELSEAEYFIAIWLITCLFDYTLGINFPVHLNYFIGPIGFVVLGYYLRHTERKLLNNPYFDLFIILASAIAIIFIADFMSGPNELFNLERYAMPIVFEVAGIFLLFKNSRFIKNPGIVFKRVVDVLAGYSYGIYLIHGMFICIYSKIIPYCGFYLFVIILFILSLISSIIVMYISNKIPLVKRVIGVKQ